MARLVTGGIKKDIYIPEGMTLEQAIKVSVPENLRDYIIVYNYGMEISNFSLVVKKTDSILITVVPQGGGGGGGGKGLLGALLMLALVVTAPFMATAMGFTGAMATAVATGITMVGALVISAMIPPPPIAQNSSGSYDSSPTYSIQAQSNSARPYSPVIKVYGRHKLFPDMGANPIIINMGTESRINAIYDFGLGDMEIEDLRIGDTPAIEFDPELHWHINSLVPHTVFVTRKVGYDQFQYKLSHNIPVNVYTKPKTLAFDVDISFSRGLYTMNNDGNLENRSVHVRFEYRQVGTEHWNNIPAEMIFGVESVQNADDGVIINGATARPFVAVLSLDVSPTSEYEFRGTRLSENNEDTKYADDMVLTMIKSFGEGAVLNLEKPHTMLEMRLLASEKIQGTVNNLSAICISKVRTTSDGINFNWEASRNPAWIAVDILTGIANPNPLPDHLIDWDSWINLAHHCNHMGYYADFIVDYVTTVKELLSSTLSLCRASFTMTTSGKYGVMIDRENDVPRQLITPANSRNFRGSRTFTERPHALRVGFIDPNMNWQKNERMVYWDGYNEFNSTKFETLETFGITSADEAWRFGRYMMAQGVHRAEQFSIEMDVENLVIQRGDLVLVSHDVPKIGGMACRVIYTDRDGIAINEELSIEPNGYSVRLDDGTIRTGAIVGHLPKGRGQLLRRWGKLKDISPLAQREEELLLYQLDKYDDINPDNLIVFGIYERVSNPYLVMSITPAPNLSAEITLVKYVKEVYYADTGEIPEWNPDWGDDLINRTELKIIDLNGDNVMTYPNRYPVNEISLRWELEGFNYHHSDIYLIDPYGVSQYIGDSKSMSFVYNLDVLSHLDWIDMVVHFEVIPISAGGLAGEGMTISTIVFADKTSPSIPDGFGVNVQSEIVNIYWTISEEPDVMRYVVRYSPDILFPDWTQSQLVGQTNWNENRLTAGARTGTYMLMSIDSSGNESKIAMQRTTIEDLPNVEVVTTVNDQLTQWNGDIHQLVKEQVKTDKSMDQWRTLESVKYMSEVLAGVTALVSAGEFGSVVSSGYYLFEDYIHLEDIYEVRIVSRIMAHGQGQFGARWRYKESSPDMNYIDPSLWDCWLEYRCVEKLDFIPSWEALDKVETMLASDSSWTDWRRVGDVADITGRLIQFKIVTLSKDPNVKVYITDGSVELDVVDRIWSIDQQEIPVGGMRINIKPPFMFNDISIAFNVYGEDRPLLARTTNKDRKGFNVELFDIIDQSSQAGKIDAIVRGQGKQRVHIL